MNKFISLIVAVLMFSNVAFAECDFSTGITKIDENSYRYTKECHIKVGELQRDYGLLDKKLEAYTKAFELKDQALDKANERINLWMDTSYKMADRIDKIESLQNKNQWIYFGLGFLAASAAVYGASRLIEAQRH